MYQLFIIFCLWFFSNSLAQNSMYINLNDEGVNFTINVQKTVYNIDDTIDINFEINNKSNKNYFLFAYAPFKEEPNLDRENNEVYYVYGGHLSSHVGLVNAMRIVKSEDKITFNISIGANTIYDDKSKFKIQSNKFYIYFGYLDYDANLDYLSKSEGDLVQIQNDKDMSNIIDLHHELIVGYIPISISNN